MDKSQNKQKDIKKMLGAIGFFSAAIGAVASYATIMLLGSEFNWLKILTTGVASAGFILFCTVVWFWITDKTEEVSTFIQNSKNMANVLQRVSESIVEPSNMQTGCQELTGSTFEALKKIQAQLESMNKAMIPRSNFEYRTSVVTRRLEDFVKDHASEISEVHIICFGRNGYEQAINFIAESYHDIPVKVIFCNPEKNQIICRKDDDTKIRTNAAELLMKREGLSAKIDIFLSDIPPAIRASIVYSKERGPVWGAIQSYNFEWEKGRLTVVRPKKSLITVGDETIARSDFERIIKCISDELLRLGGSVKKKAELRDKEVVFVDGKWEDIDAQKS